MEWPVFWLFRSRACFLGRTLEKPNGSKPSKDRQSQEGRGLAPRKGLRIPNQIIQIAVANLIGNALDLGWRPFRMYVPAIGKIGIELPRRTPYGVRQGADVFGAGRFSIIHSVLELIGRLRGDIFGCIDKIGSLTFDFIC